MIRLLTFSIQFMVQHRVIAQKKSISAVFATIYNLNILLEHERPLSMNVFWWTKVVKLVLLF